jgi:arylsulfatase A-like enzyme
LVTDLKNRGLLDDTLVIWGGEFGRSAYSQGKAGDGRDHHGRCFSMWLAGGGVKGGVSHGKTDDFSYNIAENPVHIRDLNATMLHCLGIDHERFTHRFQGLDQRLTGVEHAHAVKQILA